MIYNYKDAWTTKDGVKMSPFEMGDDHLLNTVRMLINNCLYGKLAAIIKQKYKHFERLYAMPYTNATMAYHDPYSYDDEFYNVYDLNDVIPIGLGSSDSVIPYDDYVWMYMFSNYRYTLLVAEIKRRHLTIPSSHQIILKYLDIPYRRAYDEILNDSGYTQACKEIAG